MNLALGFGWPGVAMAALVALLVGLVVSLAFDALSRRHAWPPGHALGWSCLLALAIACGIDAWHLFSLGVVELKSTTYARLALAGIHDPEHLGRRVVMQGIGTLTGVGIGLWLGDRRARVRASV